jgi:hypothetical protein
MNATPSSAGCQRPAALPGNGSALARPIDATILAYFRVVFGAVVFWQLLRYFIEGRIASAWVEPEFHFTYLGFDWVHPLPGQGLYWVCGALAVAALTFAAGWRCRVSAVVLAVGCTYLFLLEKAKYLNHGYLVCLLAWIAVFLPLHACWSLDARRRPDLRRETVPAWTLGLLRFQLALVYFYGGIAKLNGDWLRGEPMRFWLRQRGDWPFFGSFLQSDYAPWFFSYGGLLFDLLIVPALLWRRTRVAAFFVAVFFHLANGYLFTIGVFPWLAISLTALFFEPSWPRRLVAGLRRRLGKPVSRAVDVEAAAVQPLSRWLPWALGIYAAIQLLLPLRQFLYPGNVSWTEEGHDFAWHMMLRTKKVEAVSFYVRDPHSGAVWLLNPLAYITPRQFGEMVQDPHMVQEFSAHVAERMSQSGHPDAEVRAVVYLRLNDHPPALLVDPKVNLAGVKRSLAPAPWILALEPQLAARRQAAAAPALAANSEFLRPPPPSSQP